MKLQDWCTARRTDRTGLREEHADAGYAGGYTPVKEFVRTVRPREAPEPVVRFETPAGLQALRPDSHREHSAHPMNSTYHGS